MTAWRSIASARARPNTSPEPSLPGCVKIYVPDWSGNWRIVFQIAADESGLLLSYLASGVGHQPRGARAPDAYQIAHHRLHGRWPRRTKV